MRRLVAVNMGLIIAVLTGCTADDSPAADHGGSDHGGSDHGAAAGHGSHGDHGSSPGSAGPGGHQPTDPTPPGVHHADISFSEDMIQYLRQTIKLTELIQRKSKNPYLTQFAAKYLASETAKLDRMAGWLRSWNVPVPPVVYPYQLDIPGMITDGEIAKLQRASDEEFDRLCLAMLAPHLRGGVETAKTVLASGTHAETKELAQAVVTTYEADIAQIPQPPS
jgi:uncharacterized protein (DUF305 family)